MPTLEHTVLCGTEHVHTALHLNLMSGVELSTAGQAMKRGIRSTGERGVITWCGAKAKV